MMPVFLRGNLLRRGVALILVVIVIALLTTAALSFALLMQQSHMASNETIRQFESELAARSASLTAVKFAQLEIDQRLANGGHNDNAKFFVASFLEQPVDEANALSNSLDSTWAEAEQEDAIDDMPLVTDATLLPDDFDLSLPGFVAFEADADTDDPLGMSLVSTQQEIRLGMTDEAEKLNLQRLLIWERQGTDASAILQRTCGLTPNQADMLLDWVDSDSTPRPNGGEQQEYAQLGLRYGPANRVPRSYQELCLIPGFTLAKVFGKKWLLPNFADPNSESIEGLNDLPTDVSSWSDNSETFEADSSVPFDTQPAASGTTPLLQTLALSCNHRLIDESGSALIDMNQPNLSQLKSQLTQQFDERLATYIILCRQFGAQSGLVTTASEGIEIRDLSSVELDSTKGNAKLRSVLDLLDSHVIVPQEKVSLIYNSPLVKSEVDPNLIEKLAEIAESCFFAPRHEYEAGRLSFDSSLVPMIPGLSEAATNWLQRQKEENSGLESGYASDPYSTIQKSRWTKPIIQAYLAGELTDKDLPLLMNNLCQQGDTFSCWILGHSGDFRHPILARLIVDGSGSHGRQLYWQPMYLPPDIAQSLRQRLSTDQPSSVLQ